MQQNSVTNNPQESFEELFKQSIQVKSFVDHVVKGVIVSKDKSHITVDVGLKSEGRVPVSEFADSEGKLPELNIGDTVEVYIERYEDNTGIINLSREKAKREETWRDLELACKEGTPITAYVVKKVKGGFSVSINGLVAFLPGSQLDNRPMSNVNSLVGTEQSLLILKMDKKRFNIVVSRKAILGNKEAAEMPEYEEGQIVEGVVKNITNYGAFIDLGACDGLLHITDLSWSRINHPAEVLQLHQPIKVKIIKIHPGSKRLSLGCKQLVEDPWKNIDGKYQVGQVCEATVTNTVDYGVFCEVTQGVEGLVHISEIDWIKRDINTKSEFKTGDKLQVKIIEIDPKKRRVNLSIKQCLDNPWVEFSGSNPEGTVLKVSVKDINDNGIVVNLNDKLEGFIKAIDIAWDSSYREQLKTYSVGDELDAKIIKYDFDKDRVLLGIKQLVEDPFANAMGAITKGSVQKGQVVKVSKDSVEVSITEGVTGIINRQDLGIEREDQDTSLYPEGTEIEALVTNVNNATRVVYLSVKALDIQEQKKQLSQNKDEGGDNILAEALTQALNKKENKDD